MLNLAQPETRSNDFPAFPAGQRQWQTNIPNSWVDIPRQDDEAWHAGDDDEKITSRCFQVSDSP